MRYIKRMKTPKEKSNVQTPISEVQKVALQSIISIQRVEYDQLIQEAFNSQDITLPNNIPTMDDLSYDEVVIVVKYGNDKFRSVN